MRRLLTVFLLGLAVAATAAPALQVHIDATELPRHLLHASITIPGSSVERREGQVTLWYPKWIPGTHGPGGPLQNVGGLVMRTKDGDIVDWSRDPGEPYRLHVTWPRGEGQIVVDMTYITDQPSVNSDGVDSFGSELLGFISANTVLLYPDGADLTQLQIEATLALPPEWKVATALSQSTDATGQIVFGKISIIDYVDAPMFCGRYIRTYDLVVEESAADTPPHNLHVISERETATRIDSTALDRFQKMVTQSTRLFGSHPFERFDILLGLSDVLQANGLEHMSSTFNIISAEAVSTSTSLKGWQRMLVPHEYVHAWVGKYRRPAGMVTRDFHTPKDTRLLWVYEGLTQYLGQVLEVRSGMTTADGFRWQLRRTLQNARAQQGRSWRSLEDIASMSEMLRGGSPMWGSLRRGQDYYREGMLMWLAADARIRNLTDGEQSLDDFCQIFFRAEGDQWPRPFDRDEVVSVLQSVAPYDWDDFIRRHAEARQEDLPIDVVKETGYLLQFSNSEPEPPEGEEAQTSRHDARESIGARVGEDGYVKAVVLGSPADAAGLAPGLKIAGVDGHVWSLERFTDAIEHSVTTGSIELLVISGDTYVTRRVEYDGGPRHLVLVRDEKRIDRLAGILAPR